MTPRPRFVGAIAALALSLTSTAAPCQGPPDARSPGAVDYLTFARGALPVTIGGARGATMEHALRIVDGDSGGFTAANRADAETVLEVVYELPAATTFDRFAVPAVLETPSPSQTFFRRVEIDGSMAGPEGPWSRLAATELRTHSQRDRVSELSMEKSVPVRWVRLRLGSGIEMLRDQMFLEFSEIIGNGSQEVAEPELGFTGSWRGRGLALTLEQTGNRVTGCYDRGSPLEGTVTGNLLRARGVGVGDGIVSLFLLGLTDAGGVRGVRSTNGAPFRINEGDPAPPARAVECVEPPPAALGCGSVIHGINFAFDSAELRPDSEPVLAALFDGLSAERDNEIVVEGHTSSEGDETYNLRLSERRVGAVVEYLVQRGLDPSRLAPVGRGEASPLATNDDEAGRSMNRRVEIRCGVSR